jgi:hypothetical protein
LILSGLNTLGTDECYQLLFCEMLCWCK